MPPDVHAAFALKSQFAQLQGASTDTFNFDLTLQNDSPRQATFDLTVEGPKDWTVTAQPSAQTQASSVSIDAGASGAIKVAANPPDDVPAGTYPVTVHATGMGTTLDADLQVTVQGTFRWSWPRPTTG